MFYTESLNWSLLTRDIMGVGQLFNLRRDTVLHFTHLLVNFCCMKFLNFIWNLLNIICFFSLILYKLYLAMLPAFTSLILYLVVIINVVLHCICLSSYFNHLYFVHKAKRISYLSYTNHRKTSLSLNYRFWHTEKQIQ